MKMKLLGIGAVVLFLLILVPSMIVVINPGNVGVLVHRMGEGVDPRPLSVGFHWKWPVMEDIIEYPIYMQTLVLGKLAQDGSPYNEEINVNSVEGQPISCDVSISFELDPTKVPNLYSTFRTNIDMITHGFVKQTIRNVLQQVVGRTEIVNFLGKDKAKVVAAAHEELQKQLGPYGFIIKQFTLNEIRAPESIVVAIEAKNTMAQEALRAQNELQKKQFEAQQRVIEADGESQALLTRAKAQAEANNLLSASLTNNLVEYKKIEKWNGIMPTVTGGVTPLLNMSSAAASQ